MKPPSRFFAAPPPFSSPAGSSSILSAIDVPKSELRSWLREQRRALSRQLTGAAEAAAVHLQGQDLPAAKVAAGYHALGSEIGPWPVLRVLQQRGARIVLPVAEKPASPLIFRAWSEDQPLQADAARIPSPTQAAETLVPDVLIVPLLAFDRAGYRVGQGGGYYDRTLEALRASGRPVFAIGLSWAGMELDRAPREVHDQPLDAILTETGYHRVRKDL